MVVELVGIFQAQGNCARSSRLASSDLALIMSSLSNQLHDFIPRSRSH